MAHIRGKINKCRRENELNDLGPENRSLRKIGRQIRRGPVCHQGNLAVAREKRNAGAESNKFPSRARWGDKGG